MVEHLCSKISCQKHSIVVSKGDSAMMKEFSRAKPYTNHVLLELKIFSFDLDIFMIKSVLTLTSVALMYAPCDKWTHLESTKQGDSIKLF